MKRKRLVLVPLAVLGLACGGDERDDATVTFTIRAGNMEPALLINQRARFDLGVEATRGDVILIRPPRGAMTGECGRPRSLGPRQLCVEPRGGPAREPIRFVMRIVAVGRDRIRFRRGRAIVNGARENRRVTPCWAGQEGCTTRTITVPPGHVYVGGDNRLASDDSRFWGALPVAQVVGRLDRVVGTAGT